MVVMAEAFLQVLETKAIEDALFYQPPVNPLTYKRYVDDSHSRFKMIEFAETFLTVLNNQHPRIQYTMEKENEKKELEFLDMKVINLLVEPEITVSRASYPMENIIQR